MEPARTFPEKVVRAPRGRLDLIERKGRFVLIITSDHAGHGLLHGTDHPYDFKIPFIFYSDAVKMPEIQDAEYTTTVLKGMVDKIIMK